VFDGIDHGRCPAQGDEGTSFIWQRLLKSKADTVFSGAMSDEGDF
jgi:hypothetical protein